jgi:hypothetical protein
MIGAIIFVILLGAGVFKMVYDHQIYKDLEKIRSFQKNICEYSGLRTVESYEEPE